jgi:hypothetical protein
MKTFGDFCVSLLIALAVIVALMFISSQFDPKAFRPVLALGLSTGIALGRTISNWKHLSRNSSALVTGALVGLGYILASLFRGV